MAHPIARLAAAVVTLSLVCSGTAAAQARERIAFVSVVDRQTGTPVDALAPKDLVIREDRVAREVLRVAPATGPMPLAILVDNSTAAEPAIADIRNALTAFMQALGGLGPISVISMAERPTVVTDYTSNMAALTAGIQRIFARPSSGVTLVEAVQETSNGLMKREGERAAIVVLGAGGVEQSSLSYTSALERLKASGATLHAIVLSPPGQSAFDEPTRQRDTLLARGVKDTGGFRRDVLTSMAFGPALVDLARVLTKQFRVVYARPQSLIPPDAFEVAATAPGHSAYGTAGRGQAK